MNKFKLTGIAPDGKEGIVWACGECRRTCMNEQEAERCCTCISCGKKLKGSIGYATCDDCRKIEREQREKERIEKSEKLEDWNGWVYWEGAGYHDGYFESIDDFIEWLEDEGVEDWPDYVFICDEVPFPKADIDSIIENIVCEIYEDAKDDLEDVDKLERAIDEFNEANKKLISYTPNYKRMVRVVRPEANN